MVRKQIYIALQQQKTLKKLARTTGKTEAEIIRAALDQHIRTLEFDQERKEAWRGIQATIAERMKLRPEATARTWTRESLYDDI